MLSTHYLDFLHLHVACVSLSGALFFSRGLLRLQGSALANHKTLRLVSYLIDTVLLTAAILLALALRQYPLVSSWLTAKMGFLIAYIVLGSIALKSARTQPLRSLTFTAAIACYLQIIAIAVTKKPLGMAVFLS